MKFFALLPTVLLSLSLTLSIKADSVAMQPRAMSAGQMIENINTITRLSAKLQPVAESIKPSLLGKRQLLFGQFQTLITGFKGIITTATNDIQAMDDTQPYPDHEALQVCNAFREFVHVHQQLLNIVIGKSGVLQGLFLGPVAAILRSLEQVVDVSVAVVNAVMTQPGLRSSIPQTLAFGIIGAVPVCRDMAMDDKTALDSTIKKAECVYQPLGSLNLGLTC